MSAPPEVSGDLVAVACVVEASLLLASEWSRVLIEYVFPLIKRLHELHPSHQFRLALVTYGTADTRPYPLLSKKYFAPLHQVSKQLREDPSKLGIGQTGNSRGLSALEGLVAAIEFFDILMMYTPNFNHAQTQSPQKDSRSLVPHLLHIAASPPDNAQRPHCNTLPHLDSVSWDSIPAELRKRRINLSLISLKKIPQFQDLQSSVAGPNAQSPWFNVHSPHILCLAGFPTPQKTGNKRPPDALSSDQSPDAKRPKIVADSTPKMSSASPALPPARTPQNPRPQPPVSSQVTQSPSTTISTQNGSAAQAATSAPASTSATASPSAPPPPTGPPMPPHKNDAFEQTMGPGVIKQMMERVMAMERDVAILDAAILKAQNNGQTATSLQQERAAKARLKEQIKVVLKGQWQKFQQARNAQAGAGSAVQNGSGDAGPSTQSQPPNAPTASSEREQPNASTTNEHKPAIPDSQVLTQFWQSRGGTVSAPSGSNSQAGPNQIQSHPTMTPEVAAQMQKMTEKGTRLQNFGSASQTPGTTPNETGVNPTSAANNQVANAAWSGTFNGTFPNQATNDVQIHVVGIFNPTAPTDIRTEIRTDLWPKSLTLNPLKEPLKDMSELSSWLKRHQSRARIMQFKPDPRAPDGPMNEQKFIALNKFTMGRRIFTYAGWQLPSGKFSYNIFIFPMATFFAGAVFPDGLPDLPGSGNVLDISPPVAEVKPPQVLSGLTFPPALMAHMQGLEPARQKELLGHFIRSQQERLRRQHHLQQTQQAHPASGQVNSLGMSIPPNPMGAVPSIPPGLHANVGMPANPGPYNAGGGTSVNFEMMQSFMQRNADGSTPQTQGMNSG